MQDMPHIRSIRPAASSSSSRAASAGISRIGNTLDDTINRAELALFLAEAKGRSRLETDEWAGPDFDREPPPGLEWNS